MTHSKKIREIALSHFKNKKMPAYVYEAFGNIIALRTLQLWHKQFLNNGHLVTAVSSGRRTIFRSKPQLKKVKHLLRNGFKGRSAAVVMNCS